LLFGPPGGGKSHLAAALGLALVQNGQRVLFMRTTDLVQRLQVARRELGLEAAITKLDKYQLLILDDIAYVTKDQAETSVLFELIATRYERRSLLITANQPFGEWGKIFPDQAMTLAAIDRLVHHATILEMNVESYRRKAALKRKRGPGDGTVSRATFITGSCRRSHDHCPRPFATDAKALTLRPLSGHCGSDWTCSLPGPVVNDPIWTSPSNSITHS
jgi:IstB-like ATP binding protein